MANKKINIEALLNEDIGYVLSAVHSENKAPDAVIIDASKAMNGGFPLDREYVYDGALVDRHSYSNGTIYLPTLREARRIAGSVAANIGRNLIRHDDYRDSVRRAMKYHCNEYLETIAARNPRPSLIGQRNVIDDLGDDILGLLYNAGIIEVSPTPDFARISSKTGAPERMCYDFSGNRLRLNPKYFEQKAVQKKETA